jgi:hypothetical protein
MEHYDGMCTTGKITWSEAAAKSGQYKDVIQERRRRTVAELFSDERWASMKERDDVEDQEVQCKEAVALLGDLEATRR